jgi:SSS family solute:Na+ symporter
VYIGAAIIAVGYLLSVIPVGIPEIMRALAEPAAGMPSKLTVVRTGLDASKPWLGFDPSQEFTLLTAIFGFSLLTLASHGTDQDMVQRMLTCKNARAGAWSVISGVLVGIPTVLIFLIIGLLLWVFYERPDIMGKTHSLRSGDATVFANFILDQIPSGLRGLMMAGLFAAGLSTVSSTLNSMSSTFVTDIYKPFRPGRSEAHYLFAGRAGVVGWGIVLGVFACLCVVWYDPKGSTLIDFALGVMSFAYSGLLGVFVTALFTKRGNSASVIAALVAGFVTVLAFQKFVYPVWAQHVRWTDAGGAVRTLATVSITYPWQLLLGSLVATAVCMMGKTPRPVPGAHSA